MDVHHRWRPLDSAKNEIRLLTIEPAEGNNATLSCFLSTVSLDGNPTYDAVSYTWGDPAITVPIQLDGFHWQITTNLNDALSHFRQELAGKRLFVDALCIDQHNLEEKSTQVPLMGRVYSQARLVHCWLGPAAEGTNCAMEIFRQSSSGIPMKDMSIHGQPIVFNDIHSLLSFITKPYWRRAWIVQEVVLPPQAIFYCGQYNLQRDEIPRVEVLMSSLVSVVDRFNTSDGNGYVLINLINAVLQNLQGLSFALDALKAKRLQKMSNGQFKSLTMQSASVLHDHVYAYFGLLDPQLQRLIAPDYTEDVAAAFRKFAFAWMIFRGRADLLAEAIGLDENALGLPSWVPNFSETKDRIASIGRYFDVNEQCQPDLELTSCGLLGVQAFCLDYVVATCPSEFDDIPMVNLAENDAESLAYHRRWRKFFNMSEIPSDNDMYVGGGTLEDAYWRTLSKERCGLWHLSKGRHQWLLEENINACKKWLTDITERPETPVTPDIQRHVTNYNSRISLLKGTYLFRTARGYIGVTDSRVPLEINDGIFLIATTASATVLRAATSGPQGNTYHLVCGAYVHGTMLRYVFPHEVSEELPAIDFRTYQHPHMKLASTWEKIWLS